MTPHHGPPSGANTTVVRAGAPDVAALSQVIAHAFHDLPPSRWLIADTDARREILPAYFRMLVEHAMVGGIVHTTRARTAVALWLPAGPDAPGQAADYDARLIGATGRWANRLRAFDSALEQHHPADVAHHYLAILAVHPNAQGRGIGTALLRAQHQVLDHDGGAPAYLEAASQRTHRLYQRHGYVLQHSSPFYLPDGGPPLWPMWREPQQKPTVL